MEKLLLNQSTAEMWDIAFAILVRVGGTVFENVPTCIDTRFLDFVKNTHYKYIYF